MRRVTLVVCFVIAATLPAGPRAVADDCPEGRVCQTADFIDLGLGRDAWFCQNGAAPGIDGVCFFVGTDLRSITIEITQVTPTNTDQTPQPGPEARGYILVFEDCEGNEIGEEHVDEIGSYDAPEGTCRVGVYKPAEFYTLPGQPRTRVRTIELHGDL